ncbi:cilia- and flagella-associated protein 20 [Panicum miliaceum]|uniref:Cilia-and flagella-associated protein 20 n=1 Tax=Panicum miliaceum TaxID=4540 RepID=A0A3L6TBW5_PANMI|nr:cilia- and flagella-associated protein 20 [Panicum miliaceum]
MGDGCGGGGRFLEDLLTRTTKPLQIWDKEVVDGYIKRPQDEDIQSNVLEIIGTNVQSTYITCPADPSATLGIKLPFLAIIVKNLKKYFTFEIQVLDDKNVRRRFRASNFQSVTRVKPYICTMPLKLDDGWNNVQLNLADLTKRAYGTNYVETLRVQVHANCRLRRIYFSDRLYSEEELPPEFKLYLPIQRCGVVVVGGERMAGQRAAAACGPGTPGPQAVGPVRRAGRDDDHRPRGPVLPPSARRGETGAAGDREGGAPQEGERSKRRRAGCSGMRRTPRPPPRRAARPWVRAPRRGPGRGRFELPASKALRVGRAAKSCRAWPARRCRRSGRLLAVVAGMRARAALMVRERDRAHAINDGAEGGSSCHGIGAAGGSVDGS